MDYVIVALLVILIVLIFILILSNRIRKLIDHQNKACV